MGIDYFDCETCGVEMNDCSYPDAFWYCDGCNLSYCDACVPGCWVACGCSGFDYCQACITAGKTCKCGRFGCYVCKGEGGKVHTPGCLVRPAKPGGRKRRRKGG